MNNKINDKMKDMGRMEMGRMDMIRMDIKKEDMDRQSAIETVVDGEDVLLSKGESVLILAALCTLAASILSFPISLT